MECNRDEALRAKEIAEKKFLAKDISAAKKFAKKAQNLYPELEGISQMLATLNVYASAENKINGEADWYGLLDVNPLADEDTVRKQYRKLALVLHPDKNKSKGADGAFDLISQAWNLLSDKAKRSAYDQKRKAKGFRQNVQQPASSSSTPPGPTGFYNFTKNTCSNMKPPKENNYNSGPTSSHKQKPATVPASSHKKKPNTVPPASSYKHKPSTVPPASSHKRKRQEHVPDPSQELKRATFWTACHRCKMQYEYPRMYMNRNLLCPDCHEPFFSFEIEPPPTKQEHSAHRKASKNNSANPNVGSNSSHHANFQWAPFSKTAAAASAAQAASMVQQAYEKVKKEREQAQAATRREETFRRKNHASDKADDLVAKRKDMEDLGADVESVDLMSMANGVGRLSRLRQFDFKLLKVSRTVKPGTTMDAANVRIQHLLEKKARTEIQKKLNEYSVTMDESTVKAEESVNEKATNKEKETLTNGPIPSTSGGNFDSMPMSRDVPDSDFHDFDRDRTEKCFGENQVWAAYNKDDGMPQNYAMIHSVISLNPFKIRISWLHSRSNGSGFSKTCGDFGIGKQETIETVNYFSHKVRWTESSLGAVQIYPREGDVWSLYRNWSPEWNELTPDEVIHQYDIVEVLEDYDEEHGVTVIPLVKVAGFKTVFHRHLDPREAQRIPKEEILRFSNYIPSYLVTGQEAPNAPKGCWELDPAATPFELLHVIEEVKDAQGMENDKKYNEEPIVDHVGESNDDVMEEDSSEAVEEISEKSNKQEIKIV